MRRLNAAFAAALYCLLAAPACLFAIASEAQQISRALAGAFSAMGYIGGVAALFYAGFHGFWALVMQKEESLKPFFIGLLGSMGCFMLTTFVNLILKEAGIGATIR